MGSTSRNQEMLSKIAIGNGHGEDSPYFDGWKAYDSDPFHPTKNSKGVIQMGLAENKLCFDMIHEWLMKHPEASICTAEGVDQFGEIAIFQDYHGLTEFRKAVAKYMGKVRGERVTFDPNRIVMSGGATGAHETVAFCLADPGDAFLVPTPYYPGFDRDLRWRTGVKLIPVITKSSNNFKITIEALESAYQNAQATNTRVKGLLITNPSNPLGTILDKDTLKTLINFINEKNIHLVCDEIYAATTFAQFDFTSVSEILEQNPMLVNPDLIHIVYSLSKDMGFPGFRIGIIYSYNDAVVSCARKMSSFGLVSTQTQHLIASMLSDEDFIDKFIVENKKRLALRHRILTIGLNLLGITCLRSNGGLFLWMDLHKLLKEQTVDGEMELWRVIIDKVKLNVSPGSSFHCSEPGWFRVCFANMEDQTMEIALSRIREFMKQHKDVPEPRKKLQWQRSLRLSFSSRRSEDIFSTGYILSPQSSLVRAKT